MEVLLLLRQLNKEVFVLSFGSGRGRLVDVLYYTSGCEIKMFQAISKWLASYPN